MKKMCNGKIGQHVPSFTKTEYFRKVFLVELLFAKMVSRFMRYPIQ